MNVKTIIFIFILILAQAHTCITVFSFEEPVIKGPESVLVRRRYITSRDGRLVVFSTSTDAEGLPVYMAEGRVVLGKILLVSFEDFLQSDPDAGPEVQTASSQTMCPVYASGNYDVGFIYEETHYYISVKIHSDTEFKVTLSQKPVFKHVNNRICTMPEQIGHLHLYLTCGNDNTAILVTEHAIDASGVTMDWYSDDFYHLAPMSSAINDYKIIGYGFETVTCLDDSYFYLKTTSGEFIHYSNSEGIFKSTAHAEHATLFHYEAAAIIIMSNTEAKLVRSSLNSDVFHIDTPVPA